MEKRDEMTFDTYRYQMFATPSPDIAIIILAPPKTKFDSLRMPTPTAGSVVAPVIQKTEAAENPEIG